MRDILEFLFYARVFILCETFHFTQTILFYVRYFILSEILILCKLFDFM